ncbi:MAG: SusD/RagB family nutrient-binding outer membrane lipoprotein, partial [Allomuricauda sp.]
SPLVIITYAEAMFIKSEAEFLVNGGNETSTGATDDAYNAYLAGISSNMDKLGVDGTDYLADPTIAMGASGLMLNHIMKEKYIANFLNPETFVDFRRYDFSTDVFLDLALPEDSAESEYPNQWLVRAVYPDTEETRNPDHVSANKEEPTVPVWWDQ